ncbi:hypothetical protein CANCADRAFT_15606, partial [Tortispora caseinolytica NRRL Y-17796]
AQQWLSAHNTFRAQYGAQPLTWDSTLASFASNYANNCVFQHSGGPYGENLAMGYSSIAAAVKGWTDEASSYTGGYSSAAGHFTQVVWKSTTKLGCGVASCSSGKIYVCEYDPAGNVLGQFAQNV